MGAFAASEEICWTVNPVNMDNIVIMIFTGRPASPFKLSQLQDEAEYCVLSVALLSGSVHEPWTWHDLAACQMC